MLASVFTLKALHSKAQRRAAHAGKHAIHHHPNPNGVPQYFVIERRRYETPVGFRIAVSRFPLECNAFGVENERRPGLASTSPSWPTALTYLMSGPLANAPLTTRLGSRAILSMKSLASSSTGRKPFAKSSIRRLWCNRGTRILPLERVH